MPGGNPPEHRENGLIHHAVRLDVGSLQRNGDAVEEYEDQHDVIEHLVSDDLLTAHTEPAHRDGDTFKSNARRHR